MQVRRVAGLLRIAVGAVEARGHGDVHAHARRPAAHHEVEVGDAVAAANDERLVAVPGAVGEAQPRPKAVMGGVGLVPGQARLVVLSRYFTPKVASRFDDRGERGAQGIKLFHWRAQHHRMGGFDRNWRWCCSSRRTAGKLRSAAQGSGSGAGWPASCPGSSPRTPSPGRRTCRGSTGCCTGRCPGRSSRTCRR